VGIRPEEDARCRPGAPPAGLIRSLSALAGVTPHSPAACGFPLQTGTWFVPRPKPEVGRCLQRSPTSSSASTRTETATRSRSSSGEAARCCARHGCLPTARATDERSRSARARADAGSGRWRARAPTAPASPASCRNAASACSRSSGPSAVAGRADRSRIRSTPAGPRVRS
jgi:hypothetical protein